MLTKILNFFQSNRRNVKLLSIIYLLSVPLKFFRSPRVELLLRVMRVSRFKMEKIDSIHNDIRIELLFVSTRKDFPILPTSIRAAQAATINYADKKTKVIVPEKDLVLCTEILTGLGAIEVVSEESILTSRQRSQLQTSFTDRFGWVLQQVLKLKYVYGSSADGVLVIDSDTVLMSQRNWLLKNGEQILLPTYECHQPYYEYLKTLGISPDRSDFSYVSHHMLMQPRIVREIVEKYYVDNFDVLIEDLVNYCSVDSVSPFSIDYELYAHHFQKYHQRLVRLQKWSNASQSRDSFSDLSLDKIVSKFASNYASVSFHSYL